MNDVPSANDVHGLGYVEDVAVAPDQVQGGGVVTSTVPGIGLSSASQELGAILFTYLMMIAVMMMCLWLYLM